MLPSDVTNQRLQIQASDHSILPDVTQSGSSEAGSAAGTGTGGPLSDASVVIQVGRTASTKSIFDVYSRQQQRLALITVSLASVLVPLSDTVYLPALQSIQLEFKTSQDLVVASVAVYMFTVGLAALFWGPASDRFGRRLVFLTGTAAFLATSLVCIFAPNIGVLVAFRALQGLGVAAYGATGSAIIADVYAPHARGAAMGISTLPMLVGPILGPILGGALSQAFTWRSTFIAVAMYAGVVVLPLLLILPETHHYLKLRRIHQCNPQAAAQIQEAGAVLSSPPTFQAPWYPIQVLLDKEVVLHAVFALLNFGSMFCSSTELPLRLAMAPYNLSPAMIGLCYIPMGVAGIISCPLGGMLSDRAAAAHPSRPLARLTYNNAIAGILTPCSLLLFGWVLHFKLHLAVILVAHAFIGFACCAYSPALFSHLTAIKQSGAAAAAAGLHSSMFSTSGVLVLVATGATTAVGMGPFFSLLAGLNLLSAAVAAVQIFRHREQSRELSALEVNKVASREQLVKEECSIMMSRQASKVSATSFGIDAGNGRSF